MASITKRGQRWRVRIRRDGVWLTETFESKDAAEIWAAEKEAELKLGADAARSKYITQRKLHKEILLADLLKKYCAKVSTKKKGASEEISRINALLRYDICELSLAEFAPHHLDQYVSHRIEVDGVSGSTVNRELNLISHAFTTANKKWRWSIDNPVKNIDRPANNPGRDRRLEDGEEDRLIAACEAARSEYLPVIVRLAIETACRQGELLQITWRNVDLTRNVLRLPGAITKNGKARSVPLTLAAARALSEWKENANPKTAELRVFEGVTKEAIKLSYRRATKRAELADLTFHDLRHEATTRFFELHGMEMIEVMAATGHSHATMTEKYTHINAQKTANKMRGGRIILDLPDELVNRINSVSESEFEIAEKIRLLLDEALTLREDKQKRDTNVAA
jgi:integrase